MGCDSTVADMVSDAQIKALAAVAWKVRENAHVIGPTKVGCAVLSTDGKVYTGCNVEHRYRCHDVHAEVNAITTMVSGGGATGVKTVVIAAARERFTPCGGCMDWILQFAVDDCVVVSQAAPDGPLHKFTARELMPLYPK